MRLSNQRCRQVTHSQITSCTMRNTMRQYDLDKLLQNRTLVEERLNEFEQEGILRKQKIDAGEVKGHIEKAEHNLNFIQDALKLGYLDWCITGCYYAVYHAALALILKKGYSSKNHHATLCVLIKEYYPSVSKEELALIEKFFLDYQDLLFYVQSKQQREVATYSR